METERPGVRKATLSKRDVIRLRLQIDSSLEDEGRRRFGRAAAGFLVDIARIAASPVVRLSKKQRDTTDEIVSKALSDDPLVFLEGQAIAELVSLYRLASGDPRLSRDEEGLLSELKSKFNDPIIAISEKRWRIVERIKCKTHFGLSDDPPPIDIDGFDEKTIRTDCRLNMMEPAITMPIVGV
jgi:hypothetical protein